MYTVVLMCTGSAGRNGHQHTVIGRLKQEKYTIYNSFTEYCYLHFFVSETRETYNL